LVEASQYKIPRENLVIISKVLCVIHPDVSVKTMTMPELGNTRDFVNQGGLSRTAIFNQVDASLRRLGTSYVDVLQIHALDGVTPFEETMRALHDLVVAGKVRYLGASNIRAWQLVELNRIAEKHGWTEFTSVEVEHSLLYRPEASIVLSFVGVY
jgi:aryl-alcohol dehydrogenase-like predicted oxidoreductase